MPHATDDPATPGGTAAPDPAAAAEPAAGADPMTAAAGPAAGAGPGGRAPSPPGTPPPGRGPSTRAPRARGVALAVAAGLAGALAGAGAVALLDADDDDGACTDALLAEAEAEARLDGYAYDRALVVALGHAVADGHPELEELAEAVHRAEADPAGRGAGAGAAPGGQPGAGDSGVEGPPGDVAVDYLAALATLAARPELATDEVLTALEQAADGSPDLNDIAEVDGNRARGVVAVSALLRRSEAYSPTSEPAELTELVEAVAGSGRAVARAGMAPLEGTCDTSPPVG